MRRLAKDYGIITRSAVDLVDVVRALQPGLLLQHGSSLAGLCKTLLGIDVDKSLQVSCACLMCNLAVFVVGRGTKVAAIGIGSFWTAS